MKKFEITIKNLETDEVEFTSQTNSLILACDHEKDGKECTASIVRSEATTLEMLQTVRGAAQAIDHVKKDMMKDLLKYLVEDDNDDN